METLVFVSSNESRIQQPDVTTKDGEDDRNGVEDDGLSCFFLTIYHVNKLIHVILAAFLI